MNYLEYLEAAKFFQSMKYIHGADFVNATLRRHRHLRDLLTSFESEYIVDLERKLFGDSTNESSNHASNN